MHRTLLSDSVELAVERGSANDHLVVHGEHLFHFSADLDVLTCTPLESGDFGPQRVLLDWVTYMASVLAGMEAIHASAVQVGDGVLAFAAVSGSGKSTLAAEFVAAGATFFCDDVLTLDLQEDRLLAYPGAPFANIDSGRRGLAEQLGSPLATFEDELWVSVDKAATDPAPLAAMVVLDRHEDGPRSVEIRPESFITLRGLAIGLPHLRDRERRRFSMLTKLAEEAPVLRLTADDSIPADVLVSAVSEHLESEGIG